MVNDVGECAAFASNVEFVYLIPNDSISITPPPQMVLATAVPHTATFAAYQFEGFSIATRKTVADRAYRMRIFTKRPRDHCGQQVLERTTGSDTPPNRTGADSTAG